MRITRRLLERMGACKEQVERFDEAWPMGADINEENARYAQLLGLDLEWFLENLCTLEEYVVYQGLRDTAHMDFDDRREEAWDALQEDTRSARRVFEQETASAQKVYENRIADALPPSPHYQFNSEWAKYRKVAYEAECERRDAIAGPHRAYLEAVKPAKERYDAEREAALEERNAACRKAFLSTCASIEKRTGCG